VSNTVLRGEIVFAGETLGYKSLSISFEHRVKQLEGRRLSAIAT
jgi:hypothetical protein